MTIIASIQPFEITIGTSATSNTATITSVDTSKSVIFYAGHTTSHTGSALREFMPRVELTNGTTVTAYRDTSSATHTVTVRGTVVEFSSSAVTSVQQGTITIASGNTTGTATITSVDTTKAVPFWLGGTVSTSTASPQVVIHRIDLTNATTVTATRGSSSTAVVTAGYCIVEFASSAVSSVEQRAPSFTGTGTSSTDTISSIDTSRTLLIYNGASCNSSTLNAYLYRLELTGATEVTATRESTSSTTRVIGYTVWQLPSGVLNSLQRGTVALNNVTSNDATITSVDTTLSVCNAAGFSTGGSSAAGRFTTTKLFDATTVRGEKGATGATNSTASYEVAEFNASGGGGLIWNPLTGPIEAMRYVA